MEALTRLPSVSLELVDSCRVESVEIQPVQHIEHLLIIIVSPQLADSIKQAK